MVKISKKHNEHKSHSSNGGSITITKVALWQIISGILGVLLLLSLTGVIGIGGNNGSAGVAAPAAAPSAPSAPSAPTAPAAADIDMDELAEGAPFKGDEDAPVVIVEWSDFQCPFCTRFYEQTLPSIESEYIETGKVKFVFRDFPLNSIHPQAQKAGEAGKCAHDQGKFWEMHDIMFDEGVNGGVPQLKQQAADIGLDTAKFNECLDSDKYASAVSNDLQLGTKAGIRGTPGFIVNGKLISGARPFADFKAAIDAELA